MTKYSNPLEYLRYLDETCKYLNANDIFEMQNYGLQFVGVKSLVIVADLDRKMIRAKMSLHPKYQEKTLKTLVLDRWRQLFPKLDDYHITITIIKP